MSQPTCHIRFTSYNTPSFPTHRVLCLSERPVSEGSGWCNTTEIANGQGTFWVRSTSVQQTSTPWRSSRVSTTSFRSVHTWPELQPSWPGRTSSRSETAHRRGVVLSSPARGGGAWPTLFGNATLARAVHLRRSPIRTATAHLVVRCTD